MLDKNVPLPNSADAVKFGKDFTIGALAAVLAKTAIAPIERVKLILQLQSSQTTIPVSQRYKGMVDCFLRVPREQGFISLWRGNVSNCLRASSQESLGMAFKEFFKIWCLDGVDEQKQYGRFFAGNLMAGGLAGSATFCFVYPLDFSRTRLAVDMGKDTSSREFKGLVDCFVKIAKHDGFFGLYRGFLPSVQYIFIYRSLYYGIFDSLRILFSKNRKHDDITFVVAFGIGQVSTLIAAMVSYPLDTVRRRLMMQAGKDIKEFQGTVACTKMIYTTEGLLAFYSGFFVNAIRGIGAALILALYNDLSKYM
ncbi:mitochondrial carrier protein [Ditylenchus destructor]|nr:mitochondrial carrier protein [Ditylenchus destructor]